MSPRTSVDAPGGDAEQVLLNLVVNARDAMPHGGSLWVSTRAATPQSPHLAPGVVVPSQGAVLLVVRDSGVGMPESVRARAFEPFFTTKPVGKGTGLGLSSVYGTVRQSRGDVWIESEPGSGTAVFFALPATTPVTPTVPQSAARSARPTVGG